MSAKELVMKAPELCGVPNSARWSRIAEFVWDEETDDPNSVFARNEGDAGKEEDRLDTLFGWAIHAMDSRKTWYIRSLLTLLMIRHYILEHGRSDLSAKAATLEGIVTPEEAKYPDVSALLTVEAAVKGFWT